MTQYEHIRDQIQNGDMISIYSTFSRKQIFPSIVRIFTGSPVYHVGSAIWMTSPNGTRRLMLVESHAAANGKRLIPLSKYATFKFDVTPCPGDFTQMEEPMLERIAEEPYGYWDLICLGAHEFFGLNFGKSSRRVCSELVAEFLVAGGVKLPSTHVSPGRLKRDLARLGHVPTMAVNMELHQPK